MNNDKEYVIEGIVIKNVPYGENDGIITVLTENELVTFKARGILKPNGKNSASCLLYSESTFILNKSKNNLLTLIKGTQDKSNYQLYESIDVMCCLGLISESILYFLDGTSPIIYNAFKKVLEGVRNKFDIYTLTTIFLAKVIIESGYGLQTSCCVRCGNTKKIVSLNYEDGGFICQKCLKTNETIYGTDYLKTIRYIFLVNEDKYEHHVINKSLATLIINQLFDYLQERYGYKKLYFLDLFKEIN